MSMISPATTPMSTPARAAAARCFNFGAGPSVLPEEVIRQIQEDVWNYQGCGMGILEISHRGKQFDKIVADVDSELRSLASIPANYKILFMTGGATGQSDIIPANLCPKGRIADYLITGYWAEKSLEDAKFYGAMHTAATSKDKQHSYIPGDEQISYSADPAYVHMTSNNTIYGTQWHRLPKPAPNGAPLVCDASSDIFSRPIDVTKYGLIYGGAQKNLGTTGATFVIIRDDLIEKGSKDLPKMRQYRTYAKEESRPNTPPHFAIYTVLLMARWIKAQGGLAALAARNEQKAGLIYKALDDCKDFWIAPVKHDARSLMNIVFRAKAGEAMDEKFMAEAKAIGCDGLKGHRVVGGMRASTYNAFPVKGCEVLSQFIRDFAKKNG